MPERWRSIDPMSNQQIDAVKVFLESQGLVENEDYEIGPGESGTDRVSIIMQLERDSRAFPPELEAYSSMNDVELQRAIYKGCEYRSLSGARFYYALRNYENGEFRKLPAVIEHEKTLKDTKTEEELDGYEVELQRLWDEFQKTPRIAELNRELEENYF